MTATVLALSAADAGAVDSGAALDFESAHRLMLAESGTIAAARLDAEAKSLQAEAAESLGGPSVNLTGVAGRGSATVSADVSGVTSPANQMLGRVGAFMPAFGSISLPGSVSRSTVDNVSAAYLGAVYPLYTGGKFAALHDAMSARAAEAASEAQETEERTTTQLVKRYFGAQLQHRVVTVRADATRGIAEHQHQALRFEQAGLIARADRLKADTALAEARRDESSSRSDAELADIALARMVGERGAIRLASPLFVHSASIGGLQSFVERALESHPAFGRIDAKRRQADAVHRFDKAQYAPDVLLVGNYQINHGGVDNLNPNWGVGVVINIKLLDQVDRARMLRASEREQARVDAVERQARNDIATLVEMNWRSVEQARARFLAFGSGIELARENVRLAELGFREGQGTALDLVDARLRLAKIETEQAHSAYEYDVALAQLLESVGAADEFGHYLASADIFIQEHN